MPYDEGLAARLLDMLGDEPGRTEKKMFGGLAVLVGGHLAVGVYGDGLLVHSDPGEQAERVALHEAIRRRYKVMVDLPAILLAELK